MLNNPYPGGITLTAETIFEQDTLRRWANRDVSISSIVQAAGDYPTLTLRFDEKVRTPVGPNTMSPPPGPRPFRPTTADGPVPPGWREDCHGHLFAPDQSSVGYEPSRRHWFVCLSKSNFTPAPKYFALRSEAVARLQELLPPPVEEPKVEPWRPKVGDWVRVKSTGAVMVVKDANSPFGFIACEPIQGADGDHSTNPFIGHLEPWRPRVGERVAHASVGLGVVQAVNPGDEKPFVIQIVFGHLVKASIGNLRPAPPKSVPVVGAEWRDVYPIR